MGVNAAQHFMNQATFHSTFPILVITKIFDIYAKYEKKIFDKTICALYLKSKNKYRNLSFRLFGFSPN